MMCISYLPWHLITDRAILSNTWTWWQRQEKWNSRGNMNISNLPVKRYKHRSRYKVREERSGAERESEREVRFPRRINPGDERVQAARRRRKTEGEKAKQQGVVWWVHMSQVLGGLDSGINCCGKRLKGHYWLASSKKDGRCCFCMPMMHRSLSLVFNKSFKLICLLIFNASF